MKKYTRERLIIILSWIIPFINLASQFIKIHYQQIGRLDRSRDASISAKFKKVRYLGIESMTLVVSSHPRAILPPFAVSVNVN